MAPLGESRARREGAEVGGVDANVGMLGDATFVGRSNAWARKRWHHFHDLGVQLIGR